MAGGPIKPSSAVPATAGKVFPLVYSGATNARLEEALGVMASLDGDAIWYLTFEMPPSLPSGTGKLRLLLRANATSGAAKINPKWASVAAGENADTITLNAEGTSTATWSSGDDDDYKELLVTLDADTLVANEIVYMALTFETSSWTLAQKLACLPSIVWV